MSEHKPEQCWASHLPALFSCLLATSGAVLEVGAGDWSTPLLRKFCETAQREFYSFEEEENWAVKTGTEWHYGTGLTDFLEAKALAPWSLVFLDHNGHRRAKDALLFKDSAEFVVVHDWGSPDIFNPFEPILAQWKYKIIDSRFGPATLILTNHESHRDRIKL
jgi:hypothetical protein